jgi:hypothetical protein
VKQQGSPFGVAMFDVRVGGDEEPLRLQCLLAVAYASGVMTKLPSTFQPFPRRKRTVSGEPFAAAQRSKVS